MKTIDKEINLHLERQFTSLRGDFEKLIEEEKLKDANITCWVPHEVSSLVQIGWEEGLIEDLEKFLEDTAPSGKWTRHDESGTPFGKNFHHHIRTKLIGSVSMNFIVKDGKLYLGKYQDIYFYSPVYKDIPEQKIFCRIFKLD